MDSAKRRKIFFSTHERSILLNLVEARKQIIECKQTDYSTTEKKHQAWEDVAADFNSQTGVTMRNSKQLKKCWENAKAKAKKELAEVRRETMATRGPGGPELPKPSDDCLRVMAIHHYRYKRNDFEDDDDEEPDKDCPASETMCIAELQDCDYSKLELSTDSNQDVYRPGPSRIQNHEDSRAGGPAMNSHQDICSVGPSRASAQDASVLDDSSRIHIDARSQSHHHHHQHHPEVSPQTAVIGGIQEKEHYLAIQLLQEKKALQLEKHKCEMNLLKLKVEHEKRIFKLQEENEIRHRKILEVQEVFWNSNLRNLLSADDEDKSE